MELVDKFEGLMRTDRGMTISDGLAAATLIVICFVLTAGLGASILLVEEERTGPPSANFTYSYYGDNSMVIVTHAEGNSIPASKLRVASDESSKRWSTIAEVNNSSMVSPGSAITLSEQSPFQEPISNDDTVRIEWIGENQTKVLSRWPEDTEKAGDQDLGIESN